MTSHSRKIDAIGIFGTRFATPTHSVQSFPQQGWQMLVLNRKVSETIVIGGNVRITIEKVKGKRAVIGIDAPPEISILRGELLEDAPQRNESSNDVGHSAASASGITPAHAWFALERT